MNRLMELLFSVENVAPTHEMTKVQTGLTWDPKG
jgi:hypothetical protein